MQIKNIKNVSEISYFTTGKIVRKKAKVYFSYKNVNYFTVVILQMKV